jgi:hypothetical protein
MGVESGDAEGLKNMNKLMGPEKHLAAGDILRQEGLSFDFGFMLLDPWSDFRQIRSNVDFLDRFVGDGWSVAGFCRMLPYAGTPTQRKLRAEGRLEGSEFEPDYRFLDLKIDLFYAWVLDTFHTRNFTNEGLSHILRGLIFESRLQAPHTCWMNAEERRWLQFMSARANRAATTALRAAIDYFEATDLNQISTMTGTLGALTEAEKREEAAITQALNRFWRDPERQQRRRTTYDALAGGSFAKSWTFETNDWETRGVGVR